MNKCKYCNRLITWADQKYAFGHLQLAGYSVEILKPILPSHLKCAKQWIKDNNVQKSNVAGVAT